VQELDVIRAQRLKLQRQMETFKAESAEQLRQQEEQTLAMLEKVVERMQTDLRLWMVEIVQILGLNKLHLQDLV